MRAPAQIQMPGTPAAAEMAGMVRLGSALLGARTDKRDAVARPPPPRLLRWPSRRTGERNTQLLFSGPINVRALWKVALAVELGDGTAAVEALEAESIPVKLLGSPLGSTRPIVGRCPRMGASRRGSRQPRDPCVGRRRSGCAGHGAQPSARPRAAHRSVQSFSGVGVEGAGEACGTASPSTTRVHGV